MFFFQIFRVSARYNLTYISFLKLSLIKNRVSNKDCLMIESNGNCTLYKKFEFYEENNIFLKYFFKILVKITMKIFI